MRALVVSLPILIVLVQAISFAGEPAPDAASQLIASWKQREVDASKLSLVVDRLFGLPKATMKLFSDSAVDSGVSETPIKQISADVIHKFATLQSPGSFASASDFSQRTQVLLEFFRSTEITFLEPYVAKILGDGVRGRNEIESKLTNGRKLFSNSEAGKVTYTPVPEPLPTPAPQAGGENPPSPARHGYSGIAVIQTKPQGFRTLTSSVICPAICSEVESLLTSGQATVNEAANSAGSLIILVVTDAKLDKSIRVECDALTRDIKRYSVSDHETGGDDFFFDYREIKSGLRMPSITLRTRYKTSGDAVSLDSVDLVELRTAEISEPLTGEDLKVQVPPNTLVEKRNGEQQEFVGVLTQGTEDVASLSLDDLMHRPRQAESSSWSLLIVANVALVIFIFLLMRRSRKQPHLP
jgi:hypothetical protein